jgi:virginiamycin B lyase
MENLHVFKRSVNRNRLRRDARRERGTLRNRPSIEGLEGRQLLSLNVFSTPSAVETTQITKGSNGNLFFTEAAANKIGEITPAGVVTEFGVPTPNAQPTAIAAGPDGNLYFTEAGFNRAVEFQIGRITPAGAVTEIGLGFSVFAVGGITAGPDGNVYFTVGDNNGEEVGRLTAAGKVSFLSLPGGVDPGAITTGPDGNLWVTGPDDSQIFRVTTSDVATAFAVPGGVGRGITSGADGNIWFTGTTFIGRITPKGAITEFALPTKDSNPGAITAGPDGNLYFAGSSPGAGIGRITTNGVITEIAVPASGGITSGPDGNLWLTEDGKIARFVLAKPTAASTPLTASPAKVTSNTTTRGAVVDAAIEALVPVGQSGSATASAGQSTVVNSVSPTPGPKKI